MPYALWKSFGQGQFQFQLIEEKIGQVDYLSAYHALRNADGHLIGFVNLPFVNKAPRGAPELNEYLAGVISVFTLVLLLSILLAYRLAKGVASPIQALTKAMLQAKSGRKITLDEQMSGESLVSCSSPTIKWCNPLPRTKNAWRRRSVIRPGRKWQGKLLMTSRIL